MPARPDMLAQEAALTVLRSAAEVARRQVQAFPHQLACCQEECLAPARSGVVGGAQQELTRSGQFRVVFGQRPNPLCLPSGGGVSRLPGQKTRVWELALRIQHSLLILPPIGSGSKLNHQGTAGFSPCFHLPGCHFGHLFWTHSQLGRIFGVSVATCQIFLVSDGIDPLVCRLGSELPARRCEGFDGIVEGSLSQNRGCPKWAVSFGFALNPSKKGTLAIFRARANQPARKTVMASRL